MLAGHVASISQFVGLACFITHTFMNGRIAQIWPCLLLGLARGFSEPFCHRLKRLGSGCFAERFQYLCLGRELSQHTLYSGRRNAMAFGDLSDALALAAVALDGGVVQYQRIAADVLALKPGAPHAGAHPLDDQIAFQFGNGADDDHDGPAQRAAGIDIFPEADVLDLKTI